MKKGYLLIMTLLLVIAMQTVSALTTNVKGFYPMVADCITDSSPEGNNGTNNGATWVNATDGCDFESSENDYVDIDSTLGAWVATGGSLSVWAKLESWASYTQLLCFTKSASVVGIGESGANKYMGRGYDGQLNEVDSSASYNANTDYNHLTFSWDSSGHVTAFYINNVSQGTATSNTVSVSDMLHMTIGASYYGGSPGAYFDGLIMGVSIYNETISTADISELYGEGRTYDPYGAEPGDTCTYGGSGDWAITLSDNCVITTETNLPSNSIIITGDAGSLTIDGVEVKANEIRFEPDDFDGDSIISVISGGLLGNIK